MHHDKTLFTIYHRLTHRLYVGGIGSGLLAKGIGDVQIKDKSGNVRILEGVLHVPKLKNGLMSLTQLGMKGWTSIIKPDGCMVSHGDFSIHSPIKNGLCFWVQEHTPETAAFLATKSKPSLDDWHERLGNISKDTLIKFGNIAVDDLDLSPEDCDHKDDHKQCESCAYGKQHRLPFVSVTERHSKPLELVHSDMCESHVISVGGGRYALMFTDDCTRLGRVYVLSNKKSATVLKAFKDFQAWAERQSGHKIKQIRTDRGTEYMDEMIAYVKCQIDRD